MGCGLVVDLPDLIRCRGEDCPIVGGMPLAVRWKGGGMKLLVPGWYQDDRGRLTVDCPVCGHRNREPEKRSAA
jgi:hypothetical protein